MRPDQDDGLAGERAVAYVGLGKYQSVCLECGWTSNRMAGHNMAATAFTCHWMARHMDGDT